MFQVCISWIVAYFSPSCCSSDGYFVTRIIFFFPLFLIYISNCLDNYLLLAPLRVAAGIAVAGQSSQQEFLSFNYWGSYGLFCNLNNVFGVFLYSFELLAGTPTHQEFMWLRFLFFFFLVRICSSVLCKFHACLLSKLAPTLTGFSLKSHSLSEWTVNTLTYLLLALILRQTNLLFSQCIELWSAFVYIRLPYSGSHPLCYLRL